MTDFHVTAVQEFLQKAGLVKVSRETVHQALEHRARERPYHPVRDYLESLQWDGVERLPTWLPDYLDARPSPYTEEIGPMVLLSAVARVMRPGCKADFMMILEGPQGIGKSEACKILGGPFFDDSLPPIELGKEVSQHLRGKWIIEVAEMAATSRTEVDLLKSFVTRSVERFRPPYARCEVEEPRQCILIGTTNKFEYLRDDTGGRRFWPVRCGKIYHEGLAQDRDQLWAEARDWYNAGSRWWPDSDFEREHIAPIQDDARELDAWQQPIADFLARERRVTIMEVATGALKIEPGQVGTAHQRRISAALRGVGWEIKGKDRRGVRWWGPVEGAAEPPEAETEPIPI